jgi:flagellar biosynthesis protein FliR
MLFPIDSNTIICGTSVFLRVTGIVSLLPLFGEASVPIRVKILLSVALTIVLLPIVPQTYDRAVVSSLSGVVPLVLLILKELFIGIVIGYAAKLAFDGIVMAASMVSVQMGFNTSNIFMPGSEDSSNGFSALHRLLVVLIFLALNMHHIYITTIADTFKLIPAGFAIPTPALTKILIAASSGVFLTACQLAAPLLVGLLFATAALGLVSRAVPQANVFVLSFPVSFFAGLLLYMATLPMMPNWLNAYFSQNDLILKASIMSMIGR